MDDDVFRALAKQPRRELLVALAEADSRELSLDLREDGGDAHLTDGSPVELYHRHLPMLDDGGFVAWDRNAHTVTVGPRFEECEPLLAYVLEECDYDDETVTGLLDDETVSGAFDDETVSGAFDDDPGEPERDEGTDPDWD